MLQIELYLYNRKLCLLQQTCLYYYYACVSPYNAFLHCTMAVKKFITPGTPLEFYFMPVNIFKTLTGILWRKFLSMPLEL